MSQQHHFESLYPVIKSVPGLCRDYKGRQKVEALSLYAKKALLLSTEYSGCSLNEFKKDLRGAPLPEDGIYWSLSHKPLYVAAVCSPSPVGIDIEKIVPRSNSLFDVIADQNEWNIAGERSWELFFRLFTAKEAAVKTTGEGLKDLKKCTLKCILDTNHLVLYYRERDWTIEHFRIDGHIVSITSGQNPIQWKIL